MAKNFKESNAYTVIFASVMVIVVGAVLASLAFSLKPTIDTNKRIEKMQNILTTIGIEAEKTEAEDLYNQYVKKAVALNARGQEVEADAFKLEVSKESKKSVDEQSLPLFIAEKDGKTFYVIPLYGKGLWGPIWGFISLDDQLVSQGAVFDHASETPGLGAEIKQDFFQSDFKGEKIFDSSGKFAGIKVAKGNGDPTNADKEDNEVDAITGATITGDGVTAMIEERISLYLPYLKNNSNLAYNGRN